MTAIKVGDIVRIGVKPDVDPRIWNAEGCVMRMGPDDRLLVELDTGADVEVRAEHVADVEPIEVPDPIRTAFDVW